MSGITVISSPVMFCKCWSLLMKNPILLCLMHRLKEFLQKHWKRSFDMAWIAWSIFPVNRLVCSGIWRFCRHRDMWWSGSAVWICFRERCMWKPFVYSREKPQFKRVSGLLCKIWTCVFSRKIWEFLSVLIGVLKIPRNELCAPRFYRTKAVRGFFN